MTNGIVYVLHGRRDAALLATSIRVLRAHGAAIPVRVYHDTDLSLSDLGSPSDVELVRYEPFEGSDLPTAPSNRQRLVALLESPYDTTIYLDNDVFVVDPAFFDGFEIGSHYGLSLPQNARKFFYTRTGTIGDMEVGRGVTEYDRHATADMPRHMMAYNTGLIIYNHRSKAFVRRWLEEFDAYPSRGQAALCRTVWATRQAPLALPVNWLVCSRDEGLELPITLHVGHGNIMAWWKREFEASTNEAIRTGTRPHAPAIAPPRGATRLWHKAVRMGIKGLRRLLPEGGRPDVPRLAGPRLTK